MAAMQELEVTLNGVEIGATGPAMLQAVFLNDSHRVILKLTADEANFLASVLRHWADQSKLLASH